MIAFLYDELPLLAQVLYLLALVLVLAVLAWTAALFLASRRALRAAPEPVDPDGFLWVFVVPALNEEVTIADSIHRLLEVECSNRIVLVVDDGSDDATPEVLAGIEHPDLVVLRRDPPEARKGKAAALNAAWRRLDVLLSTGRWAGRPREEVILVIVDADGRLDPAAPRYAAAHLADPRVGGIQLLVRIYNRSRILTWFQDVEFSVYGLLFQAGRTLPGTAGMGGNGQFNRLSALDGIADAESGGPWRDRLTEDQDIGLRLIEAGWNGVQESRATVDQQGLPGLGRLFRQRTRWAQGNLQAMAHLGAMARLARPVHIRLDQVGYLVLPIIQGVIGLYLVVSIALVAFDVVELRADPSLAWLLSIYVLWIAGVLMGCIAWGAHRGGWGVLLGVLVANVYALYTYLLWPVLIRATARQLLRRRDWAKTRREPLAEPEP